MPVPRQFLQYLGAIAASSLSGCIFPIMYMGVVSEVVRGDFIATVFECDDSVDCVCEVEVGPDAPTKLPPRNRRGLRPVFFRGRTSSTYRSTDLWNCNKTFVSRTRFGSLFCFW